MINKKILEIVIASIFLKRATFKSKKWTFILAFAYMHHQWRMKLNENHHNHHKTINLWFSKVAQADNRCHHFRRYFGVYKAVSFTPTQAGDLKTTLSVFHLLVSGNLQKYTNPSRARPSTGKQESNIQMLHLIAAKICRLQHFWCIQLEKCETLLRDYVFDT